MAVHQNYKTPNEPQTFTAMDWSITLMNRIFYPTN